jgi:ubiquinone/menaquinone biosynthesis C-methylase UbiE
LDIGGGAGITRHYLPADVEYLVCDPSTDWLRPEWSSIQGAFPCLATPPELVRAVGEYLPFRSESFDAVLCLWSMNHASSPAKVIQEAHRVLREGGRFIVVFEDMEPKWTDLLRMPWRQLATRRGLRQWAKKLLTDLRFRKWPVQADHVAIDELMLNRWIDGLFEIEKRLWRMPYLGFDLRKKSFGL